jgi:hypothetical protein
VAGRLERYGNRLGNLHRIRIKTTAGVKLPFNPKKSASLPKTIKAHLLIAELQAEARRERFAASFDQHFADETALGNPSPMDSAQARRAQGVSL